MNFDNIELKLNDFSSELIMMDYGSSEDVGVFFTDLINWLKNLDEKQLAPICDIGVVLADYQKNIVSADEAKLTQALTFILSVLQSLLSDLRNKSDYSQKVKSFRSDLEAFFTDQVIENQLSDSQKSVLPEFISDARSLLEDIEDDLLNLEKTNDESEVINKIFRGFHTLKGEFNLLSVINGGAFAHKIESLLEPIRAQIFSIDADIMNVLFHAVDILKKLVDVLANDFAKGLSFDFADENIVLDQLIETKMLIEAVESSDSDDPENNRSEELEADNEIDLVALEKLRKKIDVIKESSFVSRPPELDFFNEAEILLDFISEVSDYIVIIENIIIELEKTQDDAAFKSLHRTFHTIEGLADFLNLEDITVLARWASIMTEMVLFGQLKFDSYVTEVALAVTDNLKSLLESLNEQVNNDGLLSGPYQDIEPLMMLLKDVLVGGKDDDSVKKPIGEILVEEGRITSDELDFALKEQKTSKKQQRIGSILQDMNAASNKDISKAVAIQQGSIDATIKIHVDKLDALIELVGELVITETQVVHNSKIKSIDDRRLEKNLAQLDRITRRLQEVSMGMRLVPIRSTFQKMLRVVRDLSKNSDKAIEVSLHGEDTELDKNVVEKIRDPLLHMVRNAVDHGIEPKSVRKEKGKTDVGHIDLLAFHRGGDVVVEIHDDGSGLDKDTILTKAINQGLLSKNDSHSDSRIFKTIFEPGFSTVDEITDVSGRGVGMDVVKRNLDQLRGKIDITSQLDRGSTFSVKLPLTLAIIEGIVVLVGRERYILPISSIIEFVNPEEKFLTQVAMQGEVYRVHNKIYPVIRLSQYFGVASHYEKVTEAIICVVESEYGPACFLVDRLEGQQQVVIKNLGDHLKHLKGVSGGAILGDGQVGLILDVNGIVSRTQTAKKT